MADGLDLLFRIKGDASGAKSATKETQQAIAALRGTIGTDFGQISTLVTGALSKISGSLTNLVSQVPGVGSTLNGLTNELIKMSGATGEGAAGFAALAGPLAIAVVGIGAMAAVTVLAAKEIFDITAATAEWEGKLFDLSQQTGVTVETLSTLDVLASQTGGSIDSITASLGIFQKNLEATSDSTSKQAKAFRALGVDVTDTEQTLRDTLTALAAMPEGFRQTSLALELFGRGGKQMLAILKESHGDLDLAKDKFRELGILVSGPAAEAADKFNDKLEEVKRQLRSVTAEIAEKTMPAVLGALNDFQRAMKDNEAAVRSLGGVVGGVAAVLGFEFLRSLQEVELASRAMIPGLGALAAAFEVVARAVRLFKATPSIGIGGAIATDDTFAPLVGTPDLGLDQIFKIAPKKRGGGGGGGAAKKDPGVALLEQLEEAFRNLTPRTELEKIQQKLFNDEYAKTPDALKKIILQTAIEIDQRKEVLKLVRERIATGIEEREEFQKMVDLVRAAGDQGVAGFVRSRSVKDIFSKGGEEGGVLGKGPGEGILNASQLNVFDELQSQLERTGAVSQSTAKIVTDTLGVAFSSLASAVGSAVQAFVLFGGVQGGFRKFAAEVIASVAAMAATQAVFELAQGLAMLALNFFFPNPKYAASAALHLKAAAVFGAIAAVSAVAGRAIAPGSDSGDAATGGGGGGTGGRGGTTGSTTPSATDINRRALQPERQIIEIRFTGDLGNVIEHRWIEKYTQGGRLRNVVISDGQG